MGEVTRAGFTPLHQAAQQGHNNAVRYLLENGASPNAQDMVSLSLSFLSLPTVNPFLSQAGHTPLAIAQKQGYVSVVETLRTVTETTVITETTTVNEERYRPQNPEAMNETMFSESEEEGTVSPLPHNRLISSLSAEDHHAHAHAKDFNDSLTEGLHDSTAVHFISTNENQVRDERRDSTNGLSD